MIQEKTLLAAKIETLSVNDVSAYLGRQKGGRGAPSKERISCTHSSRSGTFIVSQIFKTLAHGAETTR